MGAAYIPCQSLINNCGQGNGCVNGPTPIRGKSGVGDKVISQEGHRLCGGQVILVEKNRETLGSSLREHLASKTIVSPNFTGNYCWGY